jgi:hypothetical protein
MSAWVAGFTPFPLVTLIELRLPDAAVSADVLIEWRN